MLGAAGKERGPFEVVAISAAVDFIGIWGARGGGPRTFLDNLAKAAICMALLFQVGVLFLHFVSSCGLIGT